MVTVRTSTVGVVGAVMTVRTSTAVVAGVVMMLNCCAVPAVRSELQQETYSPVQSAVAPPLATSTPTATTTISNTTTTTTTTTTPSVSGRGAQAAWEDFKLSVSEMREWLGLLEDLLLSQRVTVCKTAEVQQVLDSQKVSGR